MNGDDAKRREANCFSEQATTVDGWNKWFSRLKALHYVIGVTPL